MMAENKSAIAPMLDSQGAYSNYWCGITPQVSVELIVMHLLLQGTIRWVGEHWPHPKMTHFFTF